MKVHWHRCWSCGAGHHYDEVTPHAWLDDDEAEARGLALPLGTAAIAAWPCACDCAGGPGPCTDVESL